VRVLLDTCVWGGAFAVLEAAGHDVIWTGDWPRDPGDREILARAHAETRILVTLDKDFGELAIVRGQPHHGILRLVDLPAREQSSRCAQLIERHGEELMRGAIVTAEIDRVRIRSPNDDT